MAVAEKGQNAGVGVVKLKERPKGESLWRDAWRRLRRNRMAVLGLIIVVLNILMAIFAPVIAPRDFRTQVLADNNAAPRWVTQIFPNMVPRENGGYVKLSEDYLLGADNLGRDLFSRIIYGSRVSLAVAFIGPFTALLFGVSFGLIAGYAGGRIDNLMMRFVDIMYAFPTLLLIILLMAFFRSSVAQNAPGSLAYEIGRIDNQSLGGMGLIAIGVGITSWMNLARLVRGQILSVREKEYVEAARSMGVGTRGIMFRHMLPNILGPIIVAETLTIPTYISYEAFLSFIGLGVQPPYPSWGGMISDGAQSISTYPNQTLFPAIALFLIMFAFNFLGDGLRDALDPRMRGVD